MTDTSPALLLKDVSKIFKTRKRYPGRFFSTTTEVVGLHNVNLRIGRGEGVGVIGANGSGKTTLLRILSGALTPSSGTVMAPSRPRLLSLSGLQLPNLSVLENTELMLRAHGRDAKEATQEALELVKLAELEEKAYLPFNTLSTGMRARLSFFLCAINQPEIMLVDEALSVGDPRFRELAKSTFRSMLKRSSSFVMASHSKSTVLEFCQRSIVLHNGSIVFDGPPDEGFRIHESGTFTHIDAEALGE